MSLLKKCFDFKIVAKIQIFSKIILASDYKFRYLCNDFKIEVAQNSK